MQNINIPMIIFERGDIWNLSRFNKNNAIYTSPLEKFLKIFLLFEN